jgi:hypothetical protein
MMDLQIIVESCSYELSKTIFTVADEGENTVILLVTDVNGNQSSELAIVTIAIDI